MENTQTIPEPHCAQELTLLTPEECGKFAGYIGADAYEDLHTRTHVCAPLQTGGHFIVFDYRDPEEVVAQLEGETVRKPRKSGSVRIYVSSERFVFCSGDEGLSGIIESMPPETPPYLRLLDFFLTVTADDIDGLEQIEEIVTKLDNDVLCSKKPETDVSTRIAAMRHDLIRLKRYYEQLGFITESLSECEIIEADSVLSKHLATLQRRGAHLLGYVVNLREYTTQVREAYQAQIDIEQNEIMKVFTLVAAIFLPLTLLVGWYGMNFPLPEFGWKYGYLYFGSLCVACVVVFLIIFKRKRWL